MQSEVVTFNMPQLVSAIGAVLTSLLSVYLVHRRIVADKETALWRNGHNEAQQALEAALRAEIKGLREAAVVTAQNTNPAQK